ncbi:MAG TPA: FAD-dependent oxidoreductase [Sporichthyaceae bacterium]|jgi:thioredoxin reductase (NADPH)|nr:FAD-dependent oxidoreductase [Sporichthyaceae bacterium]
MGEQRATHLAESPDVAGAYPRLSDDEIATLARYGQHRRLTDEEVLFREGEPTRELLVILEGRVAVVTGYGLPDQQTIGVHGPRRFLGELALLGGQPAFVTAVAVESGEVLAVPVDRMPDLMGEDPRLGDTILRAYLVRRSLLIDIGAGLRIIGSRFSPETYRLREFCARNRVPNRIIDIEDDAGARTLVERFGLRVEDTPVVLAGTAALMRNPTERSLARALGLAPGPVGAPCADLLIVGAGPAGLAAAVYAASEGLSTVVVDAVAPGGQAGLPPKIENYLGSPAGIAGTELAERAVLQARKFGVRLDVPARAAEAAICVGDPVVVVGGGNSAGQAALYLARHATDVTLVIRHADPGRDMSRYLVEQILAHQDISVRTRTAVCGAQGDRGRLKKVRLRNEDGVEETIPAAAVFVFIGASPHTEWLAGQVPLDPEGFVLTGPDLRSARPGVFAAGDVRSGSVKRVSSAVGEGAVAVRFIHEFLRTETAAALSTDPISRPARHG